MEAVVAAGAVNVPSEGALVAPNDGVVPIPPKPPPRAGAVVVVELAASAGVAAAVVDAAPKREVVFWAVVAKPKLGAPKELPNAVEAVVTAADG